jgi:hypothetical protein
MEIRQLQKDNDQGGSVFTIICISFLKQTFGKTKYATRFLFNPTSHRTVKLSLLCDSFIIYSETRENETKQISSFCVCGRGPAKEIQAHSENISKMVYLVIVSLKLYQRSKNILILAETIKAF